MLYAIADGASDIRNGEAYDEESRKVVKTVFGDKSIDRETLGDVLNSNYGVASMGVDVVTCMFAVH